MVVQRSQAQMLSRVVVLKRSWACESPGNHSREGQQHRGALWGRPAGDRGLSSGTRGAGQTLQGAPFLAAELAVWQSVEWLMGRGGEVYEKQPPQS